MVSDGNGFSGDSWASGKKHNTRRCHLVSDSEGSSGEEAGRGTHKGEGGERRPPPRCRAQQPPPQDCLLSGNPGSSADYLIVGAGPSGLTLAYYLGRAGKKCTLLDREAAVGGCHRVARKDGFFTEHSPRVYISNYMNTLNMLRDMGAVDPRAFFKPYGFQKATMAMRFLAVLTPQEILSYLGEALRLALLGQRAGDVSVKEFAERNGFTARSVDFLDRFCRLCDGVGADRYPIGTFFRLASQLLLAEVWVPARPNDGDGGIVSHMEAAVLGTGNVTIVKGARAQRILFESGCVTGVASYEDDGEHRHRANRVILAVPPSSLKALLDSSPKRVSTCFGDVSSWWRAVSYNQDISATFHWEEKVSVPPAWGFPASEWGLVSMNLTDYMDMESEPSQTIFSTCITRPEEVAERLGKAANEVDDPDVLLLEMFRQLQELHPGLPDPNQMLLSPTASKNKGGWVEADSAFFRAAGTKHLDSKGSLENLFQVGAQNGNSLWAGTTMETAVTNALAFIASHCPEEAKECPAPMQPADPLLVVQNVLDAIVGRAPFGI